MYMVDFCSLYKISFLSEKIAYCHSFFPSLSIINLHYLFDFLVGMLLQDNILAIYYHISLAISLLYLHLTTDYDGS